jgi:tripartite-type tricarboxylate transporter receptor subunit TctC
MRRHNSMRRMVGILAGVTATASLAACGNAGGNSDTAAEPADPADVFAGERLTIVVPYDPGGGFDTFARLLAPELEKEIDGLTVQVENRPGGGGLVGANSVYNAEPDGLTIGLINYPGAVFAEATNQEGVDFKNSDWTFLPRLGAVNPVVYTSPKKDFPTFDSVMEATEPVVFGIGGVGSDAYYTTKVVGETLGFPYKIIGGYPGSGEADGALVVGEVDASVNSLDSALPTIEGSGAVPVVLVARQSSEQLPDVPAITDFGDEGQKEVLSALASMYELERVLVAPPGVDEKTADFLAEAIHSAATGESYAAAMEEAGRTISPMSRADVLEVASQGGSVVDLLKPVIQ